MPDTNNKERIELVTNNLINITNTVNNLPNYLNTSDATALASDLFDNKTAYVNGQKITGTMNNFGDVTIDPSTVNQLYNGGYYNSININAVTANIDPNINAEYIVDGINILGITGNYQGIIINNQDKVIAPSTSIQTINADPGYTGLGNVTINAVNAEIDPNITAENIAKGINILGITGNFEGGTNTMDATATANDIAFGLTAYANNTKITGTLNVLDGNNLWVMNSSNNPMINGTNIEFSYLWNQGRRITDNGFRLNTFTTFTDLANVLNLDQNVLPVGFNTLGIEGNYTADANALSNQILENYTAYVNGVKLTGNYVPVIDAEEYAECLNLTNNILA